MVGKYYTNEIIIIMKQTYLQQAFALLFNGPLRCNTDISQEFVLPNKQRAKISYTNNLHSKWMKTPKHMKYVAGNQICPQLQQKHE